MTLNEIEYYDAVSYSLAAADKFLVSDIENPRLLMLKVKTVWFNIDVTVTLLMV